MFKSLLILVALTITSWSLSQTIRIKNNVATVNGTEELWVDSDLFRNDISIRSLNVDQEQIYCQYLDYQLPHDREEVKWIDIYFVDLDLRCEVSTRFAGGVVRLLYRNNVYVDGVLNVENASKFVKKMGKFYSARRPVGNVNIIIQQD